MITCIMNEVVFCINAELVILFLSLNVNHELVIFGFSVKIKFTSLSMNCVF